MNFATRHVEQFRLGFQDEAIPADLREALVRRGREVAAKPESLHMSESEQDTESESTEEPNEIEDPDVSIPSSVRKAGAEARKAEAEARKAEAEADAAKGERVTAVLEDVPVSITRSIGDHEVPRDGQLVRDTEGDGGEGVALFVRETPVSEVHVSGISKTVAEVNPEHPEDAPTVGVVFKGALREAFGERWEHYALAEPAFLAYRVGRQDLPVYDYPSTRLEWGSDAGVWWCAECATRYPELILLSDTRVAKECPECGEPSLHREEGGE